MPRATDNTTTPTRRAVFRGLGLTAITAGLAAAPALARTKPDDGDAELIALCAEAARCENHLRWIDTHGTSEEKCNAANDAWERVFTQVAETRATTMADIRAKARVLHLAITREATTGFDYMGSPGGVSEHLYPDGLIALSLVEDVLAAGDAA